MVASGNLNPVAVDSTGPATDILVLKVGLVFNTTLPVPVIVLIAVLGSFHTVPFQVHTLVPEVYVCPTVGLEGNARAIY
jgi:hypothetical protein